MLKIGLLFRTVLAKVLELQNHLLKLLSYFRHSSGNSEARLQATPTGKIPNFREGENSNIIHQKLRGPNDTSLTQNGQPFVSTKQIHFF